MDKWHELWFDLNVGKFQLLERSVRWVWACELDRNCTEERLLMEMDATTGRFDVRFPAAMRSSIQKITKMKGFWGGKVAS